MKKQNILLIIALVEVFMTPQAQADLADASQQLVGCSQTPSTSQDFEKQLCQSFIQNYAKLSQTFESLPQKLKASEQSKQSNWLRTLNQECDAQRRVDGNGSHSSAPIHSLRCFASLTQERTEHLRRLATPLDSAQPTSRFSNGQPAEKQPTQPSRSSTRTISSTND